MSILDDAKRFLWLGSGEDPTELLRELVACLERVQPSIQRDLVRRTQLESRIAELETKLKEANARTRAVEHLNVQLEEQLKGEYLFQRVQQLEGDLKKANERTRFVEHELVQVGSRKSKAHSR